VKVLITAPGFEDVADILREIADVDFTFDTMGRSYTEAELTRAVSGLDGVIVWIDPMTRKAIEAAGPRLKVIGVPRAGYDNVDIVAATRVGVPVVYAPGANAVAVADFTIGLLLALNRGIATAHMRLKTNNWTTRWAMGTGSNLEGKTLGILGLGNVGCRVALRAQAFGMALMAYDPYLTDDTMTALGLFPRELLVTLVDLPTLLKESDFITLHLPITEKTLKMLGAAELSSMKPTAYVINTARGGLIDENALLHALQQGQIAGAALDVFEREPLDPQHPLLALDNVIVTPHIAWCTQESLRRVNTIVAQEVTNILTGHMPNLRYLANPEVLRQARSG
jgi:D-3-phosphoglycerate dehydrogenase